MAFSKKMEMRKALVILQPSQVQRKTHLVTLKWEEISVSKQEIGFSSSLNTNRYFQGSHFSQWMLFYYEIQEQNSLGTEVW